MQIRATERRSTNLLISIFSLPLWTSFPHSRNFHENVVLFGCYTAVLPDQYPICDYVVLSLRKLSLEILDFVVTDVSRTVHSFGLNQYNQNLVLIGLGVTPAILSYG